MAPTRVGIIGLSYKGWARDGHFPFLDASPDYQIVAVCNSTVKSAQEAIVMYKLPEGTKPYSDPQDLADDENIDLVVCSVLVNLHLPTLAPSLKAGKDVYVEWPLGKNLAEAQELLRLKNEGKVKLAAVGLQAREAPILKRLKALIADGKIGKVLSSTWYGNANNGGEQELVESMCRREVGGNLVTIHMGHALDYVQFVLGYGFQEAPKTLIANRRHSTKLLSFPDGKLLDPVYPKTSDDTIYIHGYLTPDSIPLSMTLRGGRRFPGTPGLEWRIYGTTGEIRLFAEGPYVQIGYEDMKLQIHDFASGEVEEVGVERDAMDELVRLEGRNVGRVYEGLRRGEVVCSFEDAVERHEVLEGMYRENGIVVKHVEVGLEV